MDKDSQMITLMSNALIDLQVKYRSSSVADRIQLKPELEKLLQTFAGYQKKLLEEGTITTDDDIAEMDNIKKEIDKAADRQKMLETIAKTIFFVIKKV